MSLAAYAQYWRINLLTMLEYRANFFMWFGFNIVYHATAIGALWITLHNFPSLNGWDFKRSRSCTACGCSDTASTTRSSSRSVTFRNSCAKAASIAFSCAAGPAVLRHHRTAADLPDELILAITYFIFVVPFSGVHVDAAFVLYVPLVAIGGALIDGGLTLFIATLSFWIVRVDAIRWVLFSLEQEFLRYPISIYQRSVRIVLTFVLPFAFMAYFPATWLLQKQDLGLHLAPIAGLLTPVIGVAWMGLAYAFWRVGINRYQGTGS